MLVRIPDGIDDVTAAAVFLKGLTVRYLVTDSYLVSSGEFALVHAAASRVGLLLGQWRASLAAVAIGVAGGPEKAALAAHHGYAHVIDYNSDDIVANVTRLTGVPLCAAAYDSVGRTTWRVSLACLRTRGTFVSFGQSSGPVTDFRVSDLARGAFMGHPAKAFRFYSRTAGIAAEISGTVREDPGWCSEGGCRDTASAL
ncbi:zinc-binding dehydrogenase [Acetobacter musti]|nr:zinc-binding dehydrogenase [Acetobacter musti]